ncbi:MAG: protein-glutamate O-methyltransferase CheR [Candidatus Omnitrophica bacterium]|nr:protein-glutamate O-methyltransferase CheR [Candidatus Omnitrophota bacterium]
MSSISQDDISLFISLAKKRRDIALGFYRRSFIARRLAARFLATKVSDLTEYTAVLKKDPSEWDKFLDNLSINVSEFFRDPEVFCVFEKVCVPSLIESRVGFAREAIRCWSCGCSYGEEPYSIAIAFQECLRRYENRRINLRVLATDIDKVALNDGKRGRYADSAVGNIDETVLNRYFDKLEVDCEEENAKTWEVKDEVKELVRFQEHNILLDEPLRRVDVIFCRNVRIYFDRSKSKRILQDLHNSLNPDGYMVLGKVESVSISLKHLFKAVDIRNRIYQKI